MTTYFSQVSTGPGVNRLSTNPCRLLDFDYLSLKDGETFTHNTGDREVLAVILSGKGDFVVGGQAFTKGAGGRPNVFSGKPHSVYIPCGVEYLTARRAPRSGPGRARPAIWHWRPT